jgi:hypothetical protein
MPLVKYLLGYRTRVRLWAGEDRTPLNVKRELFKLCIANPT